MGQLYQTKSRQNKIAMIPNQKKIYFSMNTICMNYLILNLI